MITRWPPWTARACVAATCIFHELRRMRWQPQCVSLCFVLATDLPPFIGLAMEPGERTILKERPRPREEPAVLACMRASMIMTEAVLSLANIGVYVALLMYHFDGEILQRGIDRVDDCESELMDAHTAAFLALVWSEKACSYTLRFCDKNVGRDAQGTRSCREPSAWRRYAFTLR
mmetsp:Transcript_101002/g.294106  ORF Transcript_101002/g.294106 Transcript_101002/m.294106 type:complete len:175 (+) Transcript_101002:489-1013(+)